MNKVLEYFSQLKPILLGFLMIFSLLTNQVSGQVLVAGTQFTPTTVTATNTFYGISQVSQYGMIGGSITVTPPLTPNTNANTFNNTAYYAITTNPDTLDNVRYENITGSSNYMLVLSPPNFAAQGTLLTYTVSGLAVGSNVSVLVDYCIVEKTGTCVGQTYPLKGVINPNSYNLVNGDNTPQVGVPTPRCSTYTWTQANNSSQVVQSNGQAVFNLNQAQQGSCEAMAITRIEVYGTPAPTISSSQGTSVCTGEQTTLQMGQSYNGATYQWQISTNGGTSFTNITGATSTSYLITMGASGTSAEYRMQVTYSGTPIYTSALTISSITCCTQNGVAVSRQTIYYDDFGTLDLADDPTGKTYYTWDYTNPLSPVQVKNTTPYPFRWSLNPAPLGAVFDGGTSCTGATGTPCPLQDGFYAVAAYLTGYNPENGYNGALLAWADRVTGPATWPPPTTTAYTIAGLDMGFDHTYGASSPLGGVLLLNCPANTQGEDLYSRTITGLCPSPQITFQCYITVFTNSASGTYNPVDVLVNVTDVASGTVYSANVGATAAIGPSNGPLFPAEGVWVPINITGINLTGTSLQLDIINDENVSVNGNDLALDDISILTCSPPNISLVFDQTTLATTTSVCTSTMNLYSVYPAALTGYYGATTEFLFQYSYTPTVPSSWVTITDPSTAADSYAMTTPNANPIFKNIPTGSSDVYFRVIASQHSTFASTSNPSINYFTGGNYASSQNNVCEGYSVSPPISANVLCAQPIRLIAFNGQSNGSANALTWSTASETNNNYFTIERSGNGKNFTDIGIVKGQGNSDILNNYSFNDNAPLSGVNYYRLKQTDFNGVSTYSDVISINNSGTDNSTGSTITIYPNPNNGTFEVSIVNPGKSYTLEIVDLQGRQVYYSAGSNVAEALKVSQLAQGMYIVKVTTNNQVLTGKVVVY